MCWRASWLRIQGAHDSPASIHTYCAIQQPLGSIIMLAPAMSTTTRGDIHVTSCLEASRISLSERPGSEIPVRNTGDVKRSKGGSGQLGLGQAEGWIKQDSSSSHMQRSKPLTLESLIGAQGSPGFPCVGRWAKRREIQRA